MSLLAECSFSALCSARSLRYSVRAISIGSGEVLVDFNPVKYACRSIGTKKTHYCTIHPSTSLSLSLQAHAAEIKRPDMQSAKSRRRKGFFRWWPVSLKVKLYTTPFTRGSHSFRAWDFTVLRRFSSSRLERAFIEGPVVRGEDGCWLNKVVRRLIKRHHIF